MIKTIIFLLLGSFMLLNITGCWFIIGGAAGAAGAYAVSKDTIEGLTDKPYEKLWNATQTVAKIRGTIKSANYNSGTMELQADASEVWIRLIRLTQATTKLRISARKHHLPNISLAQELYTKIMEGVK